MVQNVGRTRVLTFCILKYFLSKLARFIIFHDAINKVEAAIFSWPDQ